MYINSWIYARCFYENVSYSNFEEQKRRYKCYNNYRPIAIVTAMSKIFELCLSRIMDAYLFTSDNQFGFKRKRSTDLCIYTVKSIIRYYNYYNSPVYTCFLDAYKAFDRINHWTMFKKLIIRDV